MEGKYVRIQGDTNQPKYLENTKDGRNEKFVYYDDNHQVVSNGVGIPSFFNNASIAIHDTSESKCVKIAKTDSQSMNRCVGYAAKKFNKVNVKYTSHHNYYKVNGKIYYQDTYFFDDGTISQAIYEKIN